MSQLLIVGCGYVGRPVARAWQQLHASAVAAGTAVGDTERGAAWALTRGGSSRAELETLGIPCIEGDWLQPQNSLPASQSLGLQSPAASDFRHLLVAVPHRPDERFGVNTHAIGIENLLRMLPNLESIVVLSTTGVYAQADGETVNEDSPAEPTRPGPQLALAAERRLRELAGAGVQAISLRLAGIYGPQRIPLLSKLQTGEPLPVADSGSINLIHIDDITTAIVRLLRERVDRSLYVLSDGEPAGRREFYRAMADAFGTPPPNFTDPAPESSRGARSETNKRIDPSRLLNELQLQLRFPDFRMGLASIAQGASSQTVNSAR
ncbi:MAG: NAD-dependent epimerase/dehydratase family protein [Pirellulales bacterium]